MTFSSYNRQSIRCFLRRFAQLIRFCTLIEITDHQWSSARHINTRTHIRPVLFSAQLVRVVARYLGVLQIFYRLPSMVKDDETVIEEFDELVNMTADELESWLKEEQSQESGWSKDDESGETIGHESGRKIIEILKKNPSRDPDKYDQEDVAHMRRVVAYNKRHLAQEEKAKQDTNSKSYKSLKNWGHDAQKT